MIESEMFTLNAVSVEMLNKALKDASVSVHQLARGEISVRDLDKHTQLDHLTLGPKQNEGPPTVPANITFSVQPFDASSNSVLFLRVALAWKNGPILGNLIYLFFNIVNSNTFQNEQEEADETFRLTQVKITFPESAQPEKNIERNDLIFPIGSAKGPSVISFDMKAEDRIRFLTSPTKIKISLFFDGPFLPVESPIWNLVAQPVKYRLPFSQADNEDHGLFILAEKEHLGGAGSQVFAYDLKALDWVEDKLAVLGGKTNEDHRVFGRPVYAVGDGFVVFAEDRHVDNPPGGKAINRLKSEWTGATKVNDIAAVRLTKGGVRVAIAASRKSDNRLMVSVLSHDGQDEPNSVALVKENLTTVPAASVSMISMDAVFFVTVTKNSPFSAFNRVTLWELLADGSIKEHDQLDIQGAVGEGTVKVRAFTTRQMLVVARGVDSKLTLTMWFITDPVGMIPAQFVGPTGNAVLDSQTVGIFDAVVVSANHLATAVALPGGKLNVFSWLVAGAGMGGGPNDPIPLVDIKQVDKWVSGNVFEIACVKEKDEQVFSTVVEQDNHTMKYIVWSIDGLGVIQRLMDIEGGAPADVSMLRVVRFKSESTVAMAINPVTKKVHISDVNLEVPKKKIWFDNDMVETLESTDRYAAATVGFTQTIVTIVMRIEGDLPKAVFYQLGSGNNVRLLVGSEIVTYGHLKQDSILPAIKASLQSGNAFPVKAGAPLALAGDTGSAAAPHLHIQADRLVDSWLAKTPSQIVAALKGTDGSIGAVSFPRPMHFTGVSAMVKKPVTKDAQNPFNVVDGVGFYWEQFAVTIPR